jgi:hypothetical protein
MNGEPGYSVPSGHSSVTLPPSGPPFCSNIVRVTFSSTSPPVFWTRPTSISLARPRSELPKWLVTQTLPWLSIPSPPPLCLT